MSLPDRILRSARRTVRGRHPGRIALAIVVVLALVATWVTVPEPVAKADTGVPSGGFALAGGLGGSVNPETGQLSVSVPIAAVHGNGQAALQVGLNWDQQRAAASIDRSGWGAGWSLASTFVSVTGLKRVYPASGGSYFIDPTTPSGLKNYKLRDLTFSSTPATVAAACAGGPAASYNYSLTYDDGRVDCFDANGNLASRLDRFGNRTNLSWQARANGVWRPLSITDSYGLVTTFDYSVANQVKVVSPKRSDGVQPVTTIALTANNGVQAVTDAAGNKTTFSSTAVSGAPKPLLTLITASTGARTSVSYQSPAYEPTLTVVDTLQQDDPTGKALSPAQTFSLNPTTENNRHNFTGYPNHLGTGGDDALFESGDANYTYTTSLTTGSIATLSTYDALHRLTKRVVNVTPSAGSLPIPAQTQAVDYQTKVVPPGNLPPNYATPHGVHLTQSVATSSSGAKATAPRTTSTSTLYDDHGRVVSATDEMGTTTTTQYDDRFGQVLSQTTTGADGKQAQLVNTLSGDGRSIMSSTTSVGTAGKTLSARQTVSYTYDTTAGDGTTGDVLTRTLSWAKGGKPADATGPDSVVTRFDHKLSVATGTDQLTTTTGYGTKDAETSTTTLDLSTGLGTATKDGLGRTTTMTYDGVGRETSVTTPGGLTTSTAYTPTQTTVTGPDGHVTRATKDLLNRTVLITDNVNNSAFVQNPAARVISSMAYSPNGTMVKGTDQADRTSMTVVDPFGRTVSQADPSGLTHLTAYDPGASNDKVDSTVPEGENSPAATTVTGYDDVNRPVSSQTNFPTSTGLQVRPGSLLSDPPTSTQLNGLGEPDSTTGNDLTVQLDHSGTGGVANDSTATPADPDNFPGQPVTATTAYDLTGAATSRTLTQGDQVGKGMAVQYDAAGHLVTATDPDGRVTSYTYDADGQLNTKTDPSGTVTTNTYDPTSGLLSTVSVTAPGKPTRTVSYTRVPAGQPGAGQIHTVSDASGTITYGYDADGHRTSVSYPDGTSTAAAYNDFGQLHTVTDVTGAVTTYVYDPNSGAMTSATQRRGTTVLSSVVYHYDGMGRVHDTTRGNGTVTTFGYSDTGDLADVSTANSARTVIEDHSYLYDSHHNPASRTDTYPTSTVSGVQGIRTWSTVYSYDAYDRLVGSAVYPGALVDGKPQGLPSTTTSYTLDVNSNVTDIKTVRRLVGIRPVLVTNTTTNTIDPAGRLTSQDSSGKTASQTFDDDGHVTKSVAGVSFTYTTDGAPATETLPDGTTTTFKTWPDGSRRSAATTTPDGHTSSITYHYGTDGVLLNDTTSDASTGTASAATASYLLTAGREARTLLPGTATSGKVAGTPATPITTGQGLGYYLRDRHTSVTAQIDSAGTVTGSYNYSDYGSPVRADGSPSSTAAADGGRTNPFTYLGAATKGPIVEPASGLLVFAARTYSTAQGRFLSPDPVDSHNRYQGFRANPLIYAEVGGAISVLDAVLDTIFAIVAVASIVLTAGAASAAVGAFTAAWAAGEVTVGLAVNVAATCLGVAANVAGLATSGTLAADDIDALSKGSQTGFLSKDDRSIIQTASTVAAAAAGVTGVAASFTEGAVTAAKDARIAANDAKLTAESFTEINPTDVGAGDQVAPPDGANNVGDNVNNQNGVDANANNGNAGNQNAGNGGNGNAQVPQEPVPGNGVNQPLENAPGVVPEAENQQLDEVFGQLQLNLGDAQETLGGLPEADEDWMPGEFTEADQEVAQENRTIPNAVRALGTAAAVVPTVEQSEGAPAQHTDDAINSNSSDPLRIGNAPGSGLPTNDYLNANVVSTAPTESNSQILVGQNIGSPILVGGNS